MRLLSFQIRSFLPLINKMVNDIFNSSQMAAVKPRERFSEWEFLLLTSVNSTIPL